MEPRCMRGKGEVCDADKVPGGNAVSMPLQRPEGTSQQPGVYRATDPLCSYDSRPRCSGPGSQASNSSCNEKATGNYQDLKIRCT
jgi:hypothetical protein